MNNPDEKNKKGAGNKSAPVFDSKALGRGQAPAEPAPDPTSEPKLLAVDCGLKTGLALFTLSGRLLWYRSHNFGSRQRLKKAAWQILKETYDLTCVALEGGGALAEIWLKTAEKRQLNVIQVQAETWRKDLLLPRQQHSGKQAKQVADELAREIIEHSGAARPTTLRHDAAEAILVGWWATKRAKIHG